MENETELNFIGTPKINEDIDFAVSYYNVTIDKFYTGGHGGTLQILKDSIFPWTLETSNKSLYSITYTNIYGNPAELHSNNSFENSGSSFTNITNIVFSFNQTHVAFQNNNTNTYYIWILNEPGYINSYWGSVATSNNKIVISSNYVFYCDNNLYLTVKSTSNSGKFAYYNGYIPTYDEEKICCSPDGKFVCLYSISDYVNYQDIIFTLSGSNWIQVMTFNGMTLGNHYSVTSQEIRTEKAFSPDETLLIESLPDLGIVKVWEWDDTNSIWNQKGQTLMEQDYSETYSSLIGDSYKDLNLGSGTGFGRSVEINISSDRIKIEDNNDNLYIFDMNELAPDTWNLQYTTNMITQWDSYTGNDSTGVTLFGSKFLQNYIIIFIVEGDPGNITKFPYIDLDIQLGIIPETINVYRSSYYYNQLDSSGNLIGDFTETSNDNASIDWNTNSIHYWTDTNDSNGKLYTIQSEDWRYRLKVEAEYAGQTYIGYVNGINNKGIELPLSGYSMTDNTITSTSEDINVKIIFVSLEGDYYKIDFEDNIFDYNLLTFYDSNETNYSLTQINNRDIYVPDSYDINDGIISSNSTIQKQFQWFRNGVAITTIQDYSDTIDTGYTITTDDVDQTITVKLTYSEEEFENNGIDFSDTFFVDTNISNIDCDLRINTEIHLTGIENTVSFLSDPTISVDSNIATTGEFQISKETTYLDRISYTFQPRVASEGIYNQLGRIYYYNNDLYNSRSSNLSTLPTNENEINDTYNPDGTLSGTIINSANDPMNATISGDGQTFAFAFHGQTYEYVICYNASDMKPFSWIESPQRENRSQFGHYMAFNYDGEYLLITGYQFKLYTSSIGSDMQLSDSFPTETGGAFLYRRNYTTNRYELYKYNFFDDILDALSSFGYNNSSYRVWSGDISDDAQYIIIGGAYFAAYFQWNDNTNEYEIVKYFDYQDFYGTNEIHNMLNTRYVAMKSDGTVVVLKGPGDERNHPMTVYEWTGESTSNIGSNPKRDDFVQIFQETDSTKLTNVGHPIFKENFIGINGSTHDYVMIYEYTPRNGNTQGSVVQRGSKINTANFSEITSTNFAIKNKSFDITNDGMILCGADHNSRQLYFFKYSIELQNWEFQFDIYEEQAANMEVVRLFEDGKVIVAGNAGDFSVRFDHYTHYFTVDYGTGAEIASSGSSIKYIPSITNGVDTPRFIFNDSTTNLVVQKDFNISIFTSTAPIADTNDTQLETIMVAGKTPTSLIINPNDYFSDADLNDQFQTDSLSFTVGASNSGTTDIDSNTFEITYTPNADLTEDTSEQLIIIATDKYGLTDEKTININILIDYPPTFVGESTTLNMYKVENLSETFTIHCLTLFTDTAHDSLTFTVDSGVGLQYGSIVIDNDRILYTVDSNINTQTTDTIQITATDTLNESVTQLFDIVIGIALDNTSSATDVPKYPRLNPNTDTNLYDFSLKHIPGVETRLVLDARNYFYEQNNSDYSLAFSGTGTYGKIDTADSFEPTFTKNRPTGSFNSSYTPPRYNDGNYGLITSLTFNEENNFRQGPFFIQSQARYLKHGFGENLTTAFNGTNFPIGINATFGGWQKLWIIQKPDGTYTFMSQYQHTEYYLSSDLNMSASDIENSLSLTIESNLNGTFSFIPSTSPTQYLITNDNGASLEIGDATDDNHSNDKELFQQNYMLYDTEVNNMVRYIINDDVTGNVQDQVTLIATNEWNLASEVTININIETVSSSLPSSFDIIQYIGEASEIVTIENISDYFLDVSGTISSFYYKTNNTESTDVTTLTNNILTHTINSTYMIKAVTVEVVPFMIYGNSDDFTDTDYTSYRIEKKFNINVEVTDIIATVDSSDVTFILNKAQGYEGTTTITNLSQYFIPLNSSDIMTYSATSQFGEITIDTDLNLTYTYNENITENTIDEILIQMTNQDNYFARKTINIDIQFYIPENMRVEGIGGTSEILLSTLFPDIYSDPEQKPQAIIDSNFGLQYGDAVVDEEITKIVYTADSNLDGVSFNDAFKVKIEEAVLIAHYEFNDPSNVGKCSVNSANDLILFDGANIVTNTLTDTPLSSQNVADFTGNTNGKALITNNINLGNSTHTISFWAYKTNTAQAFFVSQGHAWENYFVYSNDTRIKILQQGTAYYPANGSSDAVANQWVMHTIVIRENDVEKKIYINGQLYASIDTKVFENVNNGYLYIGGYLTGSNSVNNPTEADLNVDTGKDFQGYMQDLRIYSSELSAENINDLYNSTLEIFAAEEKIVTVDIVTDEPPTADTNETIFTIGQTIGDESIITTVDVTSYFTDNGPLTYSVDTNYGATTGTYIFENNNIIYTTDSNMTEDVVDQINIIAQDEVGQTVEKVFTFNIIANNKPEADTNVLSYDIYDLTIPVIVNVMDIFSDIDSGDVLTITIDTSYGLTNGTAVIADNNLSYLASVDIKDNRTDEVKLIVTDSFNATAEKILNINISPIIVQSDVNIVVYKNTPKILNLEDYITSGILLSSTVDETYGLANGFIKKDSNTPSFSEYNPTLNVIGSDSFKIILNNTIELIVNTEIESGIIEANFVEGDTNLIIEAVQGEDPKVDLSQFVSNPAEKPLEIEVTQDMLDQINGDIIIDSNTNEITFVPDENISGEQTIIFQVKIFD